MRRTTPVMNGFTIVELLVVIVVIGVLAAISLVSYSGVNKKANIASLQSDLATSQNMLKMYIVEHDTYPQALDGNNCPTAPSVDNKYCLRASSNNRYSYSSTSPYTSFLLCASNDSGRYCISDSGVASAATGLFAYNYRKALTINTTPSGANIIGADVSNFPVGIVINSSSWPNSSELNHFFDSSNSNGKRIQFYDSDSNTNLPYELESYDSNNKVAIYWVKKPTVVKNSNSTANNIIVAYGNDPNGSDQDNVANVWDSNYRAVWHLSGNQWLTNSPEATDSKGVYHGTNYGSVTNGVGLKGRYFDNIDDRINIPNATLAVGASDYTYEALCEFTGGEQIDDIIGNLSSTISAHGSLMMRYLGKLRVHHKTSTTLYSVDSNENIGSGEYHLAQRVSGSSLEAWVNGTYSTSVNMVSGTRANYTSISNIGFRGTWGDTTPYANGYIREVRVHTIARSAEWMKASAISMLATSWPGDGWISWSSEQSN